MADVHLEAEKDYISGMKYQDIAEKYGVTLNTVKSWKQRYKWTKGVHTKTQKVCTQKERKKEQHNNELVEGNYISELTEKELYFCAFYVNSWNATQSYIKAYGSRYETAMVEGCKNLRKPKIKKEIERLKEIKRQQMLCGAEDIVELHMRIAFADMGDYATFGTKMEDVMGPFGPIQVENPKTGKKENIKREVNFVKLHPSEYTDTSLIQEVKQGKSGVSIKLIDKQKSLEFLARYFTMNPMDKHKIEYDQKMLALKTKEPDNHVEENMKALAEILMQTKMNRSLEEFESELEKEVQNEFNSTSE